MPTVENQIDQFLSSLPLEPLPAGFVQRTMKRVVLEKRFRLRFLDLALPVFSLVFLSVFVLAGIITLTRLNPLWLAQVRLELQLRLLLMPVYSKWLLMSLVPLTSLVFLSTLSIAGIFLSGIFKDKVPAAVQGLRAAPTITPLQD